MNSQMIVVKEAVCDHAEMERARARECGATALVGEAVSEGDGEDLDVLLTTLVGLRSGGGNCLGWLRVETMVVAASDMSKREVQLI
jgi:hypothetical protein